MITTNRAVPALAVVMLAVAVWSPVQAGQSRSTERPYDPNAPIVSPVDTDVEVATALARATAEERRQDAARTTALNLEVLNRDRRIVAANTEAEARYREAQAEYERRRSQWQADVAACNAGDYARCSRGWAR